MKLNEKDNLSSAISLRKSIFDQPSNEIDTGNESYSNRYHSMISNVLMLYHNTTLRKTNNYCRILSITVICTKPASYIIKTSETRRIAILLHIHCFTTHSTVITRHSRPHIHYLITHSLSYYKFNITQSLYYYAFNRSITYIQVIILIYTGDGKGQVQESPKCSDTTVD